MYCFLFWNARPSTFPVLCKSFPIPSPFPTPGWDSRGPSNSRGAVLTLRWSHCFLVSPSISTRNSWAVTIFISVPLHLHTNRAHWGNAKLQSELMYNIVHQILFWNYPSVLCIVRNNLNTNTFSLHLFCCQPCLDERYCKILFMNHKLSRANVGKSSSQLHFCRPHRSGYISTTPTGEV